VAAALAAACAPVEFGGGGFGGFRGASLGGFRGGAVGARPGFVARGPVVGGTRFVGSGMGGTRFVGSGMGGARFVGSGVGGARFVGSGVGGARFAGPGVVRPGFWRGHRFHRFPHRRAFFAGAPFVGAAYYAGYPYDYGYYDECWVRQPVWTPWGYQWRLVNACY
jgi:hypothetical protein